MQDINLEARLAQQLEKTKADFEAAVTAQKQQRQAKADQAREVQDSLDSLVGYLDAQINLDLDLGVPTKAALPYIQNHPDPAKAVADVVSRLLSHPLNGASLTGTGIYYLSGLAYDSIPSLSEGIGVQLGLPDHPLAHHLTTQALLAIATMPPDAT